MFQVKDNVLVAKMMMFPSFIIIACLIIYGKNPEKVIIKPIESLFTIINYILPIIIILSLVYIYFVIKNYKDGMYYKANFTGSSFPIIFKVSSSLVFNDIGSKIRTVKNS